MELLNFKERPPRRCALAVFVSLSYCTGWRFCVRRKFWIRSAVQSVASIMSASFFPLRKSRKMVFFCSFSVAISVALSTIPSLRLHMMFSSYPVSIRRLEAEPDGVNLADAAVVAFLEIAVLLRGHQPASVKLDAFHQGVSGRDVLLRFDVDDEFDEFAILGQPRIEEDVEIDRPFGILVLFLRCATDFWRECVIRLPWIDRDFADARFVNDARFLDFLQADVPKLWHEMVKDAREQPPLG